MTVASSKLLTMMILPALQPAGDWFRKYVQQKTIRSRSLFFNELKMYLFGFAETPFFQRGFDARS